MAEHSTSLVRIGIAAVWFVSPPALAMLALRLWRRKARPIGWKATWPLATSAAVLGNWIFFSALVVAGQVGGFGTHYMTTRLADTFLLVSVMVLVASLFASVGRWQLSLASVLLLALWVGSEIVA